MYFFFLFVLLIWFEYKLYTKLAYLNINCIYSSWLFLLLVLLIWSEYKQDGYKTLHIWRLIPYAHHKIKLCCSCHLSSSYDLNTKCIHEIAHLNIKWIYMLCKILFVVVLVSYPPDLVWIQEFTKPYIFEH